MCAHKRWMWREVCLHNQIIYRNMNKINPGKQYKYTYRGTSVIEAHQLYNDDFASKPQNSFFHEIDLMVETDRSYCSV